MLIIYHANCVDGFTCAWLVSKMYGTGPEIKYLPANYGDAPPDVTNEEVLILDFSFARADLLEMQSKARWIKVIDHHKTTQDALKGLDFCTFDMSKCGSELTEDWLIERRLFEHRSLLVSYVGDRDLWKWELPYSREINACISSFDMNIANWDALHYQLQSNSGFHDMTSQGEAILRYQKRVVDSACKKAGLAMVGGYPVPFINATQLISEIGEQLCVGYPFSCTWFERPDGMRIYSLRSKEEDVSSIAKMYGGGGHKNTAGFQLPKEQEL